MPEPKKRHYETPTIWPDLPLGDEEQAQFHFDDYAATLARLITSKETRTPLTIGVSGAWGSGKTTLLRRVEKLLKETGKRKKPSFANTEEKASDFRPSKTVWFDAWKYDDEDELLVALVRVILNAMRKDGFISNLKAWWEGPEQASYDFAAMLVDAFQLSFGGLGAEFRFDPDIKKHETPSEFKTHTAFFDHFDEAFERLLALWVHGKTELEKIDDQAGVLTIFIDDLDRCLPEKTVQVLEAVKLFLDKKGCVFVLGADTRIVQQAVTRHYEKTNLVEDDPSDYLEKIIQLRFDLPPVQDDDMDEFVKKQVSKDGGMRAHSRLIALGAAANPRKVKTFLNDLNLRWAMWRNMAQVDVVDFDDFVRWEVWMRAAPDFRKRLYGMYDSKTREKLVEDAFEWAAGNEESASHFKNDINTEMRRVLEEIISHKENFSDKVIDSLVHMALPHLEEEPVSVKNVDLSTKKMEVKKAHLRDIKIKSFLSFAEIPFVSISAGEFLMGSTKDNELADRDEHPQHTVEISYDYYLARFPVTNDDYKNFAGLEHEFERKKNNHPVVNISWNDAQKYIAWLNEKNQDDLPDGFIYRLPSEAEWEKAARGVYGNEWPWGNEFDKAKCNSSEGGIGGTSPVGQFSTVGDSPYGCADMVGNVWEWTRSLSGDYPYPQENEERMRREDEKASGSRVLRGGSFYDLQYIVRCAYRDYDNPGYSLYDIGFRLCVSPIS